MISPTSDQAPGGDRPATTLVVDDDPAFLRMILAYFADNNIRTQLASGRHEMVDRLATQQVDVVIPDLRLEITVTVRFN